MTPKGNFCGVGPVRESNPAGCQTATRTHTAQRRTSSSLSLSLKSQEAEKNALSYRFSTHPPTQGHSKVAQGPCASPRTNGPPLAYPRARFANLNVCGGSRNYQVIIPLHPMHLIRRRRRGFAQVLKRLSKSFIDVTPHQKKKQNQLDRPRLANEVRTTCPSIHPIATVISRIGYLSFQLLRSNSPRKSFPLNNLFID